MDATMRRLIRRHIKNDKTLTGEAIRAMEVALAETTQGNKL